MARDVTDARIRELWGRPLPCNEHCEQAVLGVLCVNGPVTVDKLMKQLSPSMFYDEWNRGMFEWLKAVNKERWQWGSKVFASRLNERGRQLQYRWEKTSAAYRIAKMINREFATLPDMPGVVDELRRLMRIRKRIVAAERELEKAWEAADE